MALEIITLEKLALKKNGPGKCEVGLDYFRLGTGVMGL